jgi:pilus assembly protein Flp/PilA
MCALVKAAVTVLQRSNAMSKLATRFGSDESGATAIEYGLIAALIAIAIIASVGALGTAISDKFTYVQGKVAAAK